MKRSLSALLLLPILGAYIPEQEPTILHSTRPLYQQFQDIFEIEETHRYGVSEPSDSPESWWGMHELSPGPEGGVLVTDKNHHRVDLVVPDKGVTVTYSSGEGAGPGELSIPTSATFDGSSTIYIAEYGNARISVFSKSGEFIRIIRTGHTPGMIAAGKENDLWLGRSWSSIVDAVERIDPETGEIIASNGGRYRNDDWFAMISLRTFLTRCMDGMLVNSFYPYELIEYDADAGIRRIISRKAEWLTPPAPHADIPEAMDLKGGMVRQTGQFPDGSLAVLLVRFHGKGSKEARNEFILDVFTYEGQWLTTIPIAAFGLDLHIQTMTVASDGALWLGYYNEDGTPFIVRYRVNGMRGTW